MAWQQRQVYEGEGQTSTVWVNSETGETSYQDPATLPTASGQIGLQNSYQGEGQSSSQYVDTGTGKAAADQAAAGAQYTKQLDAAFQQVINNPNASSWDKAMAVQTRYGVEALAQLVHQGHFQDIAPQLGPHIAARQREGEAEGFSIGGNQLGNWPTIIGTLGFAALAGAGAAGAGSAAGEGAATGATAAEGATAGVSAGAGGEFTGGLTGTAAGSPGLSAGSFNAASLGAGGAAAAPGVTAPAAGLTGAGALSAGSFAGESMYPLIGGMSAATGATGLGTASSGALTTGGTVAGGTALSRLLDGTASAADYMSLAGTGLATGLGIYGANQQAKSLEELSGQYMAMGAPSRARYESSFLPGFSMANEPGYKDALDQTTKSFLHKASVGGNPVDSPNAWNQTLTDVNSTFAFPALQGYRSMNANAGGLSRFADAAPNAAMAGVGAQRGVYDAIGYGVGNIFNPPTSLEQLLKQMRTR